MKINKDTEQIIKACGSVAIWFVLALLVDSVGSQWYLWVVWIVGALVHAIILGNKEN